ncbi:hypothetical protein [Undibacterium danionis]|uniref:Uncharacterized protein n=1 Tax=Undibacterium danionis TaxID=1812100 RepID=A0ABV6IF06_9BURK
MGTGLGVKARRSASTVSDLQQRHVPISAIPEGFLVKPTMDSVASLAGAASRSGEMRLAILRFTRNALPKYYVNTP